MKKIALLLILTLVYFSGTAIADQDVVIADFDRGQPPNNLGGGYGAWNYDPEDGTQGCYYFDEPDDYKDPVNGFCLRLDYDVQSERPAFNGFWMKLKGLDVSKFDKLHFWVKGDEVGKFTTRFKVELKDQQGRRAVYPVNDVTVEWQEYVVDFKNTRSEVNWEKLEEFVVVFDDIVATVREGAIYLDHISFGKAE